VLFLLLVAAGLVLALAFAVGRMHDAADRPHETLLDLSVARSRGPGPEVLPP
jgi:hypothetical protein